MSERKSKRAIWAWATYDFANSPFTTLVVTFVYAAFFTKVIAPDTITGTAVWSNGVTISAIVVALLSPLLGAIADRGGLRKLFLLFSTLICIAGSTVLYTVLPGQMMQAIVWFVVANIAFEMGMVFYNAFLPDIALPEKIGRTSGYGWALGYLGGLIALIVALVTLIQPEQPWFGFSTENGENIRACNLLAAVWFAVFSLPMFLFVKAPSRTRPTQGGGMIRSSFGQLATTFREIRKYRQMVRFLVARLVFNDGLVTVFAFGGIYAQGTFDFSVEDTLKLGIVLNLAAGFGAFGLGHFDDLLGGKRTVQISLWALMGGSLLAVLAPNRTLFWIACIIIGMFAGPNQSASRALMGRFVPPGKTNEFFGFFAFSGKATAFAGPFLLGRLTEGFDSQRAGVAVVVVLFAIGLLLLSRVDEEEGTRAAAEGNENGAGPGGPDPD